MSLWQEPRPEHLGGAAGGCGVFASAPSRAVCFGNAPGDGHQENISLLPPRQPMGPPAPRGLPQLAQQTWQG